MVTWEEFKEKMFEKNKTFELDYKAIEMKYKVIDMLESYLKNNNITQQEFADRIGTTQQMISKFLTGKVNKNSDFIFKILIVIGAEIVKKNEIRVFSISIREEQIIDLKKITKINKNIRVSKKKYNFYVN
ncbi:MULTISPECIES: helix-turn-helix transcriptional regulator [Fusobacterium]|jgi:DNA-binding helix-turn-helix protein|uniref:helix-turn-helix domain-containing protein n=1 Tax=Fusobacterium TaxID=848 RepID=UPI00044EC745|nr:MULTISPECIES: helix-turn-helix transcriptional regulator [Fusobacterium]EUB37602.1 DNA-binding helix-turn-helix protein [Fusobacterium sp. OBRC1]WRL72064.1 helix-turn-helix transcriptional regulator [Fusobacterium polymorphum]